MITLYKHLNESLLGDEEELVDNNDTLIPQFLKDNYEITGECIIKNGVVDVVRGNVYMTNADADSLTNGLFSFGKIDGNFQCPMGAKLKSLEGAPKEVKGFFTCFACKYLTSLEGAPEKVGSDFSCKHCSNLRTLKGAPKEVGGRFDCSVCGKITSLEGAPEKVKGNFSCTECYKLKSLEGAPKEVGGVFDYSFCDSLDHRKLHNELKKIKAADFKNDTLSSIYQ